MHLETTKNKDFEFKMVEAFCTLQFVRQSLTPTYVADHLVMRRMTLLSAECYRIPSNTLVKTAV